MRISLLLLALCLLGATNAVATEASFQEQIDSDATMRTTILTEDTNTVYWNAVFPGDDAFGAPTTYLSFKHSVNDIDPSLMPNGVIKQVRLKLFIRNGANGELEVTVDSLDLDNVHRRQFLVGPDQNDSISVHESVLKDGELEIVLSSTSNDPDREAPTFVLFRSVLDVIYEPALAMDVADTRATLPNDHFMSANYPNPFNPSTTIEYTLPTRSHVRVEVLNVLGRTVRLLTDAPVSAGLHRVVWDGRASDGSPVASGIYYYRIVAGDLINARKMILLK